MRPTAMSFLLGCTNAAIVAVVLIAIDRAAGSLLVDALVTAGLALLLAPLNAAFWRAQRRSAATGAPAARPDSTVGAAVPGPVPREP